MNEQDYILIERYLLGAATEEEARTVAERAANEPTFAAALAERQHFNDHLRAAAQEDTLLPTLERLSNEYFTEQAAPVAKVRNLKGSLRWVYGVVAAAVIALAVWFLSPSFTDSNGYEQFAHHEPLTLTERGDSLATAAAAEEAYNAGRYAAATPLLEQYLAQNTTDARARLALGVTLLETDRDSEAVEVFQQIADGGTSLAPYGNWYLALAAVKRGDETAARKYLSLIPASDAYLAKKAKELRATL